MQSVLAVSPRDRIEAILASAFAPSLNRLPRSPEYSEGARAALLQRFVGKPFACPHKEGTAAADAFFAGADEGRRLHADHCATGGPSCLLQPTHRLEIRNAASGQWAGRIYDGLGEEVAGIGGCLSADEVEQGAYEAGFTSLEVALL